MQGLFDLPSRSTKTGDSFILEKATKKQKANNQVTVKKGAGGLLEKIPMIKAMVQQHLGDYEQFIDLVRDVDTLWEYARAAVLNGYCSIDTETSSLDPITCTLVGISLKTWDRKTIYVPINHVDYITNSPIENQIPLQDITEIIQFMEDAKIQWVFANAGFDYRVIKNQAKVRITPYWDTYIAARLLNENEPSNSLKMLHSKYVQTDKSKAAFNFSDLFSDVPFQFIPINVGYIYAGWDAHITEELFEFQRPFLTPEDPLCIERGLEQVAWVFHEMEMPIATIVSDMEDTGIMVDQEYCENLSIKYKELLQQELDSNFGILTTFGTDLDNYRKRMGAANKLEYPVNLASPTQVAIVLYDILKIKPVDPKAPRGTGEEILEKIDHPIAESILRYRGLAKLLSTYIENMPKMVNKDTGKIHTSFNPLGADTGRFTSKDPNMQNIPRDNKDIRKMFRATPGYALISSDYSAQEPRLTAHLSNDERMIEAYRQGKDLYVEIAALAYNLPYDECLEFRADGTKNPEGKKRRQIAKAIVLGVVYSKGVPSIAKDLNIDTKKAQEIYDKIMKAFPGLKTFMDDSLYMARTYGYVTTVWGRKRRLPDVQMERYTFSKSVGKNGGMINYDPLADDFEQDSEISEAEKATYIKMLNKAYGRVGKEQVKQQLAQKGITVIDNSGYIAQAERQVVNSRVQGSAADQIKLAIKLIGQDELLKQYQFRLILQVHDELIGEAPIANAKKAAERFAFLMREAAKDLKVPSVCDVEITERWSGDPLSFE